MQTENPKNKAIPENKQELLLSQDILRIVREFNALIRNAITGPNCIDPNVCHADCCYINIDIPKVLAEYFVNHHYAEKTFFKRGSLLSYEIKVDFHTLRCVFYDRDINGCKLHNTGMKPPQCWVYPTGLNPDDYTTSCKRAEGWKIVDSEKVKKAKKLIDEYIELGKREYAIENSSHKVLSRLEHLQKTVSNLNKTPPYKLSGIYETWDALNWKTEEGYSMSVKYFCKKRNCNKNFLQCQVVCNGLLDDIITFLKEHLYRFISIHNAREEYSFRELIDFASHNNSS